MEKIMHKKISRLFLAAIVMTLAMAGSALAQTNYGLGNNSPVPVTITVNVTCPGPPVSTWSTTATLAPGATALLSIPGYPCSLTNVVVNGNTYPVGYNGAAPAPLTGVRVTIARTLVW